LSSGAKESHFGDELEVAAWVFPERLPELLKHPARLEHTSALHWAAAANRVEAISLLLAAGVDVNRRTFGHWAECVSIKDPRCTALVAAAWANALEAAKLLVEAGAAIEPEGVGETPVVHVAARRGSLDVLKFLVEKGADFNREFGVHDITKRDAFECAVDAQAYVCARFWIEPGAKVSVHNLLSLIEHGHGSFDVTEALSLLELMISRGADVNHCEYPGQRRPILSVIDLGEPRIVEALIRAGALGADEATTREAFQKAQRSGDEAITAMIGKEK
jgi:ankyrin repeat protein